MNARPRFRSAHAFTLVELLVVIAVVALLIGVLLPALAGARSSGWQIKDASLQKQLLLGTQTWSNSNDLSIPGANTSGLALRNIDEDKLDSSGKPTQNWDWLTAALDDGSLPEDRSERFVYLFDEFANPANKVTITDSEMEYGSKPGDLQDYITNTVVTFNAPSYFMAATWQWAGPDAFNDTTNIPDKRYVQPAEEQGVALLPSSWFPRVNNVGQSSNKVAISNAFYDLDDASPKLEASIWLEPQDDSYGAFCSSTPCKADSKNFVVDPKNENLSKCFPHSEKLNAGFWDGHVASLDSQECQDPSYWYPKGSIMKGTNATTLARASYDPEDKIN